MFTGIIEEIGTVSEIKPGTDLVTLKIKARKVLEDVKIGDSIAVNGVCLTVISFSEDYFGAGVQAETVRRTTIADLKSGAGVNLERALSLSSRLGGHFVLGHIDNTGTIKSKSPKGKDYLLVIKAPEALLQYVVAKGSIAIDGISLTVGEVTGDTFSVYLIPHTLQNTTLTQKNPGDAVNLETDIIGKYVAKSAGKERKSDITKDFLSEQGFV